MEKKIYSKSTLLICGLILFVFNILMFLPAMKGDFVFDDIHLVRNSPITQNPNFLNNFLWQAFGDPLGKDANSKEFEKDVRYYRPLTSFSLWLDFKLWRFNAAGFHLTNILIHSFNVILLFLLIFRIFGNSLSAFASASLFSVFPTHFENVAWISGRTDLLALFFLLISAHFFLSFLKNESSRDTLLAALFFFLALLSKETVILSFIVFACLFLLYSRKSVQLTWLSFVLSFSIVFLFIFLLRQKIVGFPSLTFSVLPLGSLFSGLGFYLARMVFPFFLGLSVPDEKILHSTVYLFLGIVFCLSLIAAFSYFLFKKKSLPFYLLWGLLSFLLLLPSLLILFFANPMSLLAWRFLYIPLAAAIPLLATFLSRILRPMLYCLLVATLVLFYGVELLPHVRHYGQSDRDFWINLPHVERESRIFRLNHAAILFSVNEKKAAILLESLIKDRSSYQADLFRRRALEIGAFYCTSVNHLEKARYYFAILFAQYKEQPLNDYFQYAYFLAKSGNPKKGQEIILHYLEVFPENHEVLLHGAEFFLLTRDYPRALELLQKDFQLFPTKAVLERIRKLQANQQQN